MLALATMTAKLSDIAAQAGVSEATVSRVLNDRPGVAAAKRQAVLTALDLLGYERPARLRRRSGRSVGLILPELSNPIFPAFAQALGSNLARRGFTPVLGTQSDGGVHEDEYIDMLLEAGAAAIVFVCGRHADTTHDLARYQQLRELGIPLALINGYREGLDAAFFSVDDKSGVALAVRHLASMGHQRIGLATGPVDFVSSRRKVEAFEALADGVGAEARVEYAPFTEDGGSAATRALLAQDCTAIVCGSDVTALGVLTQARRDDLTVPGDLSVVGFDDSLVARHSWPPLTTIRQPVTAMSLALVDALVGEINGIPASRTEYVFSPELIVRESTGPRQAA
jgi:DNA-binding LacI/PurR family transcriptional regulator